LASRREIHERSAMLWDEMAQRHEMYEQRAIEREGEKALRDEAARLRRFPEPTD
jgi:hypothetical protein